MEALKWIRKAADQDFAQAQYLLGLQYSIGDGVPKDEVEAVKWIRKAAEENYDKAQYYLGLFICMAKGSPKILLRP